jgi:hypothetical protein
MKALMIIFITVIGICWITLVGYILCKFIDDENSNKEDIK